MNSDGYIDDNDLIQIQDIISPENFLYGDLNGDEEVNVVDVITVVNQVLGIENYGEDSLFDVNQDGILNVVDIIALVNIIVAQG
jgi:hypothetical protein